MIITTILFLVGTYDPTPAAACEELSRIVRVLPDRLEVCEEIGAEAILQGVPVELAISLCWHESRFSKTAISRAGARGPCQVLPKYADCVAEARPCDWIEEGVLMMVRWARRAFRIKGRRHVRDLDMLAMYHGGHSPPDQSYAYARKIMKMTKRLQKQTRTRTRQ